jgi:outer membrane biosynthesis protein TonB
MANAAAFDDGQERNLTWLWILLGVLALAAAGYGIWLLSNATIGKQKPAPPSTTALLLPPPPPPPPPPPQEKPPEPVETAKPVPVDVPTPSPAKAEAPAAVSINAEATGAAGDYGLTGGGPGGMGGVGSTGTGTGAAGGISDGFYRQNLRNALQQRIQDQDSVNRQVFSADFAVWVDSRGRVTKAEMLRTSGDAKRDERLLAILQSTTDLDAPPASIRFPARITVRGRKSSL